MKQARDSQSGSLFSIVKDMGDIYDEITSTLQ